MPGGQGLVKAGGVVHGQSHRVWELVGPDPAGRASNKAACSTDDRSPPVGGKALPQLQWGGDAHELLATLEQHLASPATALGNGDEWGLVQRWLLVAVQRDNGGGDSTKR